MKNFLVGVKKFFSNKNTVTIIGILLAIVILYIGYTYRVKKAVTLISVPVATQEIGSRTIITEEMFEMVSVNQQLINKGNVATSRAQIIDKYVGYGTTIPKNSLFYLTAIMAKEEMPDVAFADIPDNYTIFSLPVNMHTTYGNSIFPGNDIDLFFKAMDDNNKVIYGKLIEHIEVLAVKDSSGNHVFETTVESRTPAELLFAVPDDMYELLMKAGYVPGHSIEINPVPRNAEYSAKEGATIVSSDWIKEFILSKTTYVPQNEVVVEEPTE